ncbi:MAG TPA: signal peptidase II, partial [Thermoanaerobaculia bacterium]|nr:signal peptidase II [Thermoanaerobaculia bacterium]
MKRVGMIAIMLLTIALDQYTKHIARQTLAMSAPRHYSILTLLYAENSGAFLSLGANLPPETRSLIFSGVVAVALAIGMYALMTNRIGNNADSIAVAFILGGGIGNLIDRVARGGRVSDFLYLAVGPLHTGVFNVADIAITGGVIWLLISW